MAASDPSSSLASHPFLQVPSLDSTYGAVLIGTFVSLILYGVTLHQIYRYFRTYIDDPMVLKAMVTCVLLLETLVSIMTMHTCYYYLITYYFQPTVLLVGVWSMNAIPAVSGVTIAVTQSFFARRVYIFGPRYRAVVAVVVVLTICELGFFVAATVETFEVEDYESFKHVTWLISTAAAISLAEDVLLTTVLIYALCRSRKGIKRTNAMIDVMIMYTINTGFLTSVFNFLYMFFSLSRPDDMVYIGIGITALKIYSNSLMAALNSREALKAKISGVYIETSHPGLDGQSESPTVLRGVHVEASANTASSFESVVLELSAKPQLLAVPYTAENREDALHNSAQSE
ncbi:hypothetical protein C8T65DRAFT_57102 [Cerioporus squamosus]|nr:hypothetical protein C8T65DRAFT_57102 [Cerioporus squamosus]